MTTVTNNEDRGNSPTITVNDGENAVSLNPLEYNSFATFISKLHSELDVWASQMQEVKLKLIWLQAHGKEIPEYMEPLLKDSGSGAGE